MILNLIIIILFKFSLDVDTKFTITRGRDRVIESTLLIAIWKYHSCDISFVTVNNDKWKLISSSSSLRFLQIRLQRFWITFLYNSFRSQCYIPSKKRSFILSTWQACESMKKLFELFQPQTTAFYKIPHTVSIHP